HIDAARRSLRIEGLLDRFQGYMVHLRVILTAVFEPLRDECEATFGWCPADIYRVGRGVRDVVQRRLDLFHPGAHNRLVRAVGTPEEDRVTREVVEEQAEFGSAAFMVTAAEVSAVSGLPEATIDAALSTLSIRWGDQPDFRRPTQDSRARRYGVVALGGNSYFVPLSHVLV